MGVVYQGCKDLQDKLEEVASQSGYVVYPSRSFDHRHHQPPKMEDSGRQNPPTMTDYITLAIFVFRRRALFSNRERERDHAIGHNGSACGGKWRNINSDGAHVRWARVSAKARIQVSAAVHGHSAGGYRAAKNAVADEKCEVELAAVIGRL